MPRVVIRKQPFGFVTFSLVSALKCVSRKDQVLINTIGEKYVETENKIIRITTYIMPYDTYTNEFKFDISLFYRCLLILTCIVFTLYFIRTDGFLTLSNV